MYVFVCVNICSPLKRPIYVCAASSSSHSSYELCSLSLSFSFSILLLSLYQPSRVGCCSSTGIWCYSILCVLGHITWYMTTWAVNDCGPDTLFTLGLLTLLASTFIAFQPLRLCPCSCSWRCGQDCSKASSFIYFEMFLVVAGNLLVLIGVLTASCIHSFVYRICILFPMAFLPAALFSAIHACAIWRCVTRPEVEAESEPHGYVQTVVPRHV